MDPSTATPTSKYSGTLEGTVFDPDGNDMRAADYAGVVVEGVNATTGEASTVAVNPQSHFFLNQGYIIHAADQYDAGFVKLREMRLDLPGDMVDGTPFSNVSIGVFGRNLAILHKNVPHIDPEVPPRPQRPGLRRRHPGERTIGNLKFSL